MDYVSDDNNYTFITLNQIQEPNPKIVKIENNFVNDLTIGNYYEFKFYYENSNNYEVNSTYDSFYYYELLSIKETNNKLGLELSSYNTCKKVVN